MEGGKDPEKVPTRGKQMLANEELSRRALAAKVAVTGYVEWAKESAETLRAVAYDNGNLKGAKAEANERAPKDAPQLPEGYKALPGVPARAMGPRGPHRL